MIKFVTQYIAPFMAGVLIAAATIVASPVSVVALLLGAGAFSYVSFPPGGRMMRRLAGVPT